MELALPGIAIKGGRRSIIGRNTVACWRSALLAMLILLFPLTARAATAPCPASDFVIGVGNAIDRAARRNSPAAFAAVVAHYSDLRGISFFALGRYRKLMPREREAEYLTLTRDFVGQFLADHAGGFRTTGLKIVTCTGDPSAMTVSIRLASSQKVVFRLYRAGSGYMIRDVNLESIWLAQQMRSTFVGTLSRSGGDINALFSFLRR